MNAPHSSGSCKSPEATPDSPGVWLHFFWHGGMPTALAASIWRTCSASIRRLPPIWGRCSSASAANPGLSTLKTIERRSRPLSRLGGRRSGPRAKAKRPMGGKGVRGVGLRGTPRPGRRRSMRQGTGTRPPARNSFPIRKCKGTPLLSAGHPFCLRGVMAMARFSPPAPRKSAV